MKKRILAGLLSLIMAFSLLPASALGAEGDLDVNVVFPTGEEAVMTFAPAATISEVKTAIENKFSISFENDGYWLYCNDVKWDKDNSYRLDSTGKTTLQDYDFQSGWTIYVHQNSYVATEENPIHVFGLTIYGGTGAPEPYGSYQTADFCWNYYYKSIQIRTDTPITISGTGEDGASVTVMGGSDWKYVTFKDVTLNNSNDGCIWINPRGYLCLTLEGKNQLTAGDTDAVVTLSNGLDGGDKAYLWIQGEGTLDITSTKAGVPAIGPVHDDTTAWVTLQGGTVTATGGAGAPGIQADRITVNGGTLTAVSGGAGCPGLIGNDSVTIGDGMYVKTPAGGSVQADAYQGKDMIAVDADTPAQTVVVAPAPQSFSITYVLNGGQFGAGQSIGAYTPGQVTTLPTPEREGYLFDGWYEDAAFTGGPVTEIGVDAVGDKTFYAKWEPAPAQQYTLTFETNGGSTVAAVTKPAGTAVALDQTPVRSGYTFTGWYTEEALENKVTSVTLTGDMTVYAGWQKVADGEALYQKEEGGEWLLDTFVTACAEVYDGGTIKLVKDVDVKKLIVFVGRDVTITSNDPQNPCTIYRAADFETVNNNGRLLMANYAGVYLKDDYDPCVMRLEHICLDGRSQEGVVATGALVANNASVLYLGEGVSLQNNSNTDATVGGFAGGIYNFCGEIIMEAGSQIVNCEASTGGGIFSEDGTITINGGKIEGNKATADISRVGTYNLCGGGIYCRTFGNPDNSTVNLISGSISNNTAGDKGGALYFTSANATDNLGALNMTGGTIQGNTAKYGGGAYVVIGELTLTDGAITGNTATTNGGGIYCAPYDHAIYLSGSPKVTGNTVGTAANNIVMDGLDTDTTFYTKSIILQDALHADAAIGVTRKQTPTETEPVKLVAEPAAAYTITEDDLARFSSDDPAYALEMREGNIVMTIATRVAGLTVSPTELTMDVGDTAQLTATVTPEDASNKAVVWSSSDESIATVDANGVVTAKAVGKATITATTVDGGYTASCQVTVRSSGGGPITAYYTLTFESNGGSEVQPIRAPYGTVIPLNQTTTRDGYAFTGWYLDEALTQPAASVTLTRDMTVYAGWRKTAASPDDTGVSGWLDTTSHVQYLSGYPGGLFIPNGNMTRAEAAQMFYNLLLDKDVPITVSFTDVDDGAWYADAVHTLASLGVLNGVGGGSFAPGRSITRAEFTAIAMRFAELSTGGSNIFSDVPAQAWYYDYVVGSVKYGWIAGYPDGTFRPNATITRAEAAAIVNRMLGRSADETYIMENADRLTHFADLPDTHWAYFDIMEAANSHDYSIVNGTERWKR